MKNLTKQWGSNPAVPTELNIDFAFKLDNTKWKALDKIIQRLNTYEKTGLEPEEILAIFQNKADNIARKQKCTFCNAPIYMKVQRNTIPMAAPLTHVGELQDEIINLTGKEFVPVPKRYCPICGKKLSSK